MARGLVFFDVDGTLVPGGSSGQHLAGLMGHLETSRHVEERYAAGEMTNQEASVLDARGWAGHTPAGVRGLLASLPLVDGIDDTVAWCRRRGLAPVVTTLAWAPVGAYLCERFGFDRACGPSLAVRDGRYTGEVAVHLDEVGKRDYAMAVADELGVAPARCAAVGDSRSDLPLFAGVGFAVAFNGTPAARAAAHATAGGSDLRVVLPLLARWLARFTVLD